MSKIHYATGGLITPGKAEFSTMCGRKFPKGTSDIMQSGYTGAKNVTCEDCRFKIDTQQKYSDRENIWFRVTDGHMSSTRFTEGEAKVYLREMRKGFPKNVNMTEENHRYWKKHAKREYIIKVTENEELVSF